MNCQLIVEFLTDQIFASEEMLAKELGLSRREVRPALDALLEKAFIVEEPKGYRLRS
jgi:biotin operon repressor